jgi:hypothetical protein
MNCVVMSGRSFAACDEKRPEACDQLRHRQEARGLFGIDDGSVLVAGHNVLIMSVLSSGTGARLKDALQ